MALSFTERRKHLKAILKAKNGLRADGVTFKEKRPLQKMMKEAKTALRLTVSKPSGRLAELVAGKFNNQKPVAFLDVVKDILEKGEAKLEEIKKPVINYYTANLAS
jgi:ubiquinone/menaquinone biosynthesis C-methylase UbiE